ncbi:MAG: hypothetical protein LBE86_00300 [Gemmobacter sp.]|jgi:hypothetical protein|nr:hypothetical protein [Gemmobacter sp.]
MTFYTRQTPADVFAPIPPGAVPMRGGARRPRSVFCNDPCRSNEENAGICQPLYRRISMMDVKEHEIGWSPLRSTGVAWTYLLAFMMLMGAANMAPAQELADPAVCRDYVGTSPETSGIKYYDTAPYLGGEPSARYITYSTDYLYKPVWVPVPREVPADAGLFKFNFVTGGSYTERQQAHGQLEDAILILIHGYSYSRPEYGLAAEAGFYPIGEPLTWPDFTVGQIAFASFHTINVVIREGEGATSQKDIFAEINDDGSMKSLLSCKRKAGVILYPSCNLREQVDGWRTTSNFFRSQLPHLEKIRRRRDDFIHCISGEE